MCSELESRAGCWGGLGPWGNTGPSPNCQPCSCAASSLSAGEVQTAYYSPLSLTRAPHAAKQQSEAEW